jgi:hypothetical protein
MEGHVGMCNNLAELKGQLSHVMARGALPTQPLSDYCIEIFPL